MDCIVYTRHAPDCSHKDNRFWRKCRCIKWVYEERSRKRYSAKTRSWSRAETVAAGIEAGSRPLDGITLKAAVQRYLEDKRQQSLSEQRVYKLEILFEKQMLTWADGAGVTMLRDLDLPRLEDFRKTWKGVAITNRKRQESVSSFFGYCMKHKWVESNPVKELSPIKVRQVPTDYFNKEEFAQIMAAVEEFHPLWRDRIRALVLLLRYSGLRMSDAITLERSRIADAKLFLYTQKTGTAVHLPIHKDCIAALKAYDSGNPKYFFWSGNGKVKSAVADAQRSLRRLFQNSGLAAKKRCHPHMFRDTFAVELLLAGTPIEQVAAALGHSSVKTTIMHYNPWAVARQAQLEEAIKKAW